MPHIYKVTLNGEIKYIGFTSKTLHQRWSAHLSMARRGSMTRLYCAIRKYGKEAFSIESIIEHEDAKYLRDVMESKLITEHKTHYRHGNGGYNMTDGGEGSMGCKPNDESRRKMSLARLGKPHSKEHRFNISIANMGKIGPMMGKHHSAETKAKMSIARMGRINSPETRRKLSIALKGKIPSNKGKPHSAETKAKISKTMIAKSRKSKKIF